LQVLVVDDEALSRDELIYLLRDYPNIQVCGEAATGDQALQAYRRLLPDVVFLDIQMPGRCGLQVARELLRQPEPPLIVFATAYDQHAVDAFEVEAIDYLLKPFSAERLARTVHRLVRNLNRKERAVQRIDQLLSRLDGVWVAPPQPVRLTVDRDGRWILFKHTEVAVAYAEGRAVFIKTGNDCFRTALSLHELEDRLPSPPFFRCHRGYLVNLDWVKEIHPWFNGAYQLVLADQQKTQVPVSRLCVRDLRQMLNI